MGGDAGGLQSCSRHGHIKKLQHRSTQKIPPKVRPGPQINLNKFQLKIKMTLVCFILVQSVSAWVIVNGNGPAFKTGNHGYSKRFSPPAFQRVCTTLGGTGGCGLSTSSPFHTWKNQKLHSVVEGKIGGLAKKRAVTAAMPSC